MLKESWRFINNSNNDAVYKTSALTLVLFVLPYTVYSILMIPPVAVIKAPLEISIACLAISLICTVMLSFLLYESRPVRNKVSELILKGQEINEKILKHLKRQTKLKDLDLSDTKITGDQLKYLPKSLIRVDLTGCSEITDDSIQQLEARNTGIRVCH